MSMVVKVYRSDGDIKRELLYEIRTSSSNDLFLILMNLLLKNFNIQVEVVDNSRIATSSNNNGDTSSDDKIQDEYWFMNG